MPRCGEHEGITQIRLWPRCELEARLRIGEYLSLGRGIAAGESLQLGKVVFCLGRAEDADFAVR